MEIVNTKHKKSDAKKQNWAIDPETGKKVHKRWIKFLESAKNPGTILDMKAVLR